MIAYSALVIVTSAVSAIDGQVSSFDGSKKKNRMMVPVMLFCCH
jgi:hypothetical protein